MQNTQARLLLLLPPPRSAASERDILPYPEPSRPRSKDDGISDWTTGASAQAPIAFVQAQRDALLRLRGRLSATIRHLQAENEALRLRLAEYERSSPIEGKAAEWEEARDVERDHGIRFNRMPDGVYPGRPYVTQQELIRQGITSYTRQNISRLARDEGAIPAVVIADRVLLPPAGVRALVERERIASRDPSPRRRPGSGRRTTDTD